MRRFAIGNTLLSFIVSIVVAFLLPEQRVQAAAMRVDDTCSLHDAIIAANTDRASGGCPAGAPHDSLQLSRDITLSAPLPPIIAAVAIEGNGYTISGDAAHRIFDVNDGLVWLNNLTLSRGKVRGGNGAALLLRNSALVTVENVTFSDNSATAGGAIAVDSWNGRLTIRGSRFSENRSQSAGGAVWIGGGTVTISESSFNDNWSVSGGAIGIRNGRLHAANSSFSNNQAYRGGAIYVNGAEATLSHLTMRGNRARDGGGDGLVSRAGLVYLRNSIIAGASGHDDCSGRLEQNRGNLIADWSCGASLGGQPLLGDPTGDPAYFPLADGSPALDAADPEFCPETDQRGEPRPQGGGCDIGAYESATATPASTSPLSVCTLAYQIIAANQDRWIGACPAGNGADTIVLTQDLTLTEALPRITSEITILGNGRTISGDQRFRIFDVDGGDLNLVDLTLAHGNAGDEFVGGAIYLDNKARVSATNVTFLNNRARRGGAIYVRELTQLRISRSRLRGNSAKEEGGAIYIRGRVEINRSDLSENVAGASGGAVYILIGAVQIENATLSQNRAALGGAIYVDDGKAALTHVSLLDNQARDGGDAIHRQRTRDGQIDLRNSIIAGGSDNADCAGPLDQNVRNLIEDGSCLPTYAGDPLLSELPDSPGLYAPQDASPALNAADPRFCPDTDQGGRARPVGAGCDIGAVESTSDFAASAASECTLYDHILAANLNKAVRSCPAGTNHDVIFIREDITLREALPVITGTITIEGGGHTISGNNLYRIFEVRGGNLTIKNLTLTKGYSERVGGALLLHRGGRAAVHNSAFSENTAKWGGAIAAYIQASELSLSGSQFLANRALISGGAVDTFSGTLDISDSSFINNSARDIGGALSLGSPDAAAIANSSFVGNRAEKGGAIRVRRAETSISHVTMLNNQTTERGQGRAIFTDDEESNLRLRNSILAGGGETGALCHGSLKESSGNLIADGSCSPALAGEPLLADLTGSPPYLPLRPGSPAIDAALPEFCPATDQVGNPRPQGGGCDIGAIEYMGE